MSAMEVSESAMPTDGEPPMDDRQESREDKKLVSSFVLMVRGFNMAHGWKFIGQRFYWLC